MDTGYSLSDIATATNGGMFGGNNEFIWIFALLILFGGGFGNFGRGTEQFATSAEVQRGFDTSNLEQQIRGLTYGLSDSTFALNNAITTEGRALQTQLANCCCENQRNVDALRYDMAQMNATTNANLGAQIQSVKDMISQNKIESLQAQVSELKTSNLFCGIPRINPYGYGVYPYANNCCGCNCGNI
jgi:hypothetical protein